MKHYEDPITMRERLRLVWKVIRCVLFHERYKAFYYLFSRKPFKQNCYVCGKVHVLYMADPWADKSDCDECWKARNALDGYE